MAVQTAATLKGYFNTGDTPTEAQFADLIDSSVNEAYSLPTASTTILGGVKIDGTTVTITDGVISSSGSGMTNPMTTAGDIIYGGTSGAPTRLAKGADGQVCTLVSGLPSWAAASGGGAIDWASPIAVTTTTTLTIGKHHVCTGTTADYTAMLPAVSGNVGKLLAVEMSGALTKLVTIDGNGSETIDGATTRVMWARETAILLCDGTQWTKIAGKSIPMVCVLAPNANQTFSNNVFTKLALGSSVVNIGDMGSTTNSNITIRRGGAYDILGSYMTNSNNASNGVIVPAVYRDTSQWALIVGYAVANANATGVVSLPYTTCTAGQVFELYGYYSTGSMAITAVWWSTYSATYLALVEKLTW